MKKYSSHFKSSVNHIRIHYISDFICIIERHFSEFWFVANEGWSDQRAMLFVVVFGSILLSVCNINTGRPI